MTMDIRGIPDVLAKIAAYKKEEVAALKAETSEAELRKRINDIPRARGFTDALIRTAETGPAIIAEVKKASPSKGIIREDFDPVAIAKAFARNGAACLSVLTDGPGFQGSTDIFARVRHTVDLPMLRKDFMIDPIQITESRSMGADAVLVIMAMIDDTLARDLMETAAELGMDALVETHDQPEMDRALALGANLIGVNNRDLRTFHTDIATFGTLSRSVPLGKTLIAESGIFTRDHIEHLTGEGAQGFLIGESLMRADNIGAATRHLTG